MIDETFLSLQMFALQQTVRKSAMLSYSCRDVIDNDFNYAALISMVKIPSIITGITIRDAQIAYYDKDGINVSRITWYR